MKKILKLVTLTLILFMVNSGIAQNNKHSSAATPAGESWLPVNEFNSPVAKKQNGNTVEAPAPLKNVLDGVSFYTMNAICNSNKVILLKLINTNDYAVDIEWKLNPNEDKITINIPANESFEGNCSSSKDDTISKLVVEIQNEPSNANSTNYLFKSVKVLNTK